MKTIHKIGTMVYPLDNSYSTSPRISLAGGVSKPAKLCKVVSKPYLTLIDTRIAGIIEYECIDVEYEGYRYRVLNTLSLEPPKNEEIIDYHGFLNP